MAFLHPLGAYGTAYDPLVLFYGLGDLSRTLGGVYSPSPFPEIGYEPIFLGNSVGIFRNGRVHGVFLCNGVGTTSWDAARQNAQR